MVTSETVPVAVEHFYRDTDEYKERGYGRTEIRLRAFFSESNVFRLSFATYSVPFVERVTKAVLLALEGIPMSAGYPEFWRVFDGESTSEGDRCDAPLVFEPSPRDGEVLLSLSHVPEEPYRGRIDMHDYEHRLPEEPVPVDAGSLIMQLRGLFEQQRPILETYLPVFEENPEDDFERIERLAADLRVITRYYDEHGTLEGFQFDTSLDSIEDVLYGKHFEPTGFRPVREEWVANYVAQTESVLEAIVDRIRERDPETARQQYKKLFYTWTYDNTLAQRKRELVKGVIDILTKDPDKKAIPAIKNTIFGDTPEYTPALVTLIGELLTDTEKDDSEIDLEDVCFMLVEWASTSDLPNAYDLAVEAIAQLGPERARKNLNPILEMQQYHEDGKQTAEAILEDL